MQAGPQTAEIFIHSPPNCIPIAKLYHFFGMVSLCSLLVTTRKVAKKAKLLSFAADKVCGIMRKWPSLAKLAPKIGALVRRRAQLWRISG